ncbi:MAG: hypothetical protein DBW85_02165 [Synechococcus sp. MED-G71]|nr:MAG: hypothetical protein DBW85_02165 [Synechococcus sp. MED-G71]
MALLHQLLHRAQRGHGLGATGAHAAPWRSLAVDGAWAGVLRLCCNRPLLLRCLLQGKPIEGALTPSDGPAEERQSRRCQSLAGEGWCTRLAQ